LYTPAEKDDGLFASLFRYSFTAFTDQSDKPKIPNDWKQSYWLFKKPSLESWKPIVDYIGKFKGNADVGSSAMVVVGPTSRPIKSDLNTGSSRKRDIASTYVGPLIDSDESFSESEYSTDAGSNDSNDSDYNPNDDNMQPSTISTKFMSAGVESFSRTRQLQFNSAFMSKVKTAFIELTGNSSPDALAAACLMTFNAKNDQMQESLKEAWKKAGNKTKLLIQIASYVRHMGKTRKEMSVFFGVAIKKDFYTQVCAHLIENGVGTPVPPKDAYIRGFERKAAKVARYTTWLYENSYGTAKARQIEITTGPISGRGYFWVINKLRIWNK
jgi:hypothetical protein